MDGNNVVRARRGSRMQVVLSAVREQVCCDAWGYRVRLTQSSLCEKFAPLPPIRQPGLAARIYDAHSVERQCRRFFMPEIPCDVAGRFLASVCGEPRGSPGS